MGNTRNIFVLSISKDSKIPEYDIPDYRFNKPFYSAGDKCLLQDFDTVKINGIDVTYSQPNNIGISLTVAREFAEKAQEHFNNKLDPHKSEMNIKNIKEDQRQFLTKMSAMIVDYIQMVQCSIVFGYCALESFSNISIPNDFGYKSSGKKEGITEIYNKDAIERWISLEEKLTKILPQIYSVGNIRKEPFWNDFKKLQSYRHDIVHQKSIKYTEFFKEYFKKDIFNICLTAEKIIAFFQRTTGKEQRTHPLWPWIKGMEKNIPVVMGFKGKDVKYTGNLFSEVKK